MSTIESSAVSTSLPTGTWNVDPVHSSVEFHVKHLGIATVKGKFKEFEGTLEVTPEGATGQGSVKVSSVDTGEPQRDGHLLSADFFDAENIPEITFKSTSITAAGDDEFDITGDFSIHGHTHPLTLKATL